MLLVIVSLTLIVRLPAVTKETARENAWTPLSLAKYV